MKKIKEMWNNASFETKQRTLIFFITWVFSIYALIHNIVTNGFAIETIESLVATVVTGGASIASWWKNNSFSAVAIQADEYKDILKLSVFEEIPTDEFITEEEDSEKEDE